MKTNSHTPLCEDYVSFKIAQLLREKGFNETCRAFWKEWNGEISFCGCNSSHTFKYCCNTMLENYNDSEETNVAAPTLQMAMKWLRAKELVIYVIPLTFYCGEKVSSWGYNIWAGDNLEVDNDNTPEFTTYEEACEAAIKYCLENLI